MNSKLKRFPVAASGEVGATPSCRTMTIHRAPGSSLDVLHLPAQTEELTVPLASLRRDVHGTALPGHRLAKPCRSYSLTYTAGAAGGKPVILGQRPG